MGYLDVVSGSLWCELLGFAHNVDFFCKSQIAVAKAAPGFLYLSIPDFAVTGQSQRCTGSDVVRQYPAPDVNAMKI